MLIPRLYCVWIAWHRRCLCTNWYRRGLKHVHLGLSDRRSLGGYAGWQEDHSCLVVADSAGIPRHYVCDVVSTDSE